MNKLWLLLVIPILIFAGLACVSSDDGAAADSIVSKINAMQATILQHTSVIDSLRSDLNDKASKSEIDDINRKINNLPQGGSTPADTATKAIVDQKIADAISALKADQAWIKGSTHTTPAGTTAGEFGELVDTDGDLELWLEKTSGDVSDIFVTRNGVCSGRFDFIVVNKDTRSSHDYRISIALTPDSDVILQDNATLLNTTKNAITASGGLLFTMSRVNSGRNPLNAYQTNEDRITKGDNEDITVWLTVDQLSASSAITEWDYSINIDDRD
jgi:hypothetical protein